MLKLLEQITAALKTMGEALKVWKDLRTVLPPKPILPPVPVAPVAPKYLWGTPADARHSVRVICDERGLSPTPNVNIDGKFYTPKDIICACIMRESGFNNLRIDGSPTRGFNYRLNPDKTIMRTPDGKPIVASTDWGICQINDTKGWHIGPGCHFKDVDDVVKNPTKAVNYMVDLYESGQIRLWSSYSTGAYKKYLPK